MDWSFDDWKDLATRDLVMLRRKIRRVPYRRSVPPWGISNDLLRMLLFPKLRVRGRFAGVGMQVEDLVAPCTMDAFVLLLANVRCRRTTPLRWHASWLVEIPKKQGATGWDAVRDLHLFAPFLVRTWQAYGNEAVTPPTGPTRRVLLSSVAGRRPSACPRASPPDFGRRGEESARCSLI